jgi:mycothiol synthase
VTGTEIQRVETLTEEQADEVRRIVAEASRRPGDALANPPINERGMLHLRSSSPFGHLIAVRDGTLVGYAQIDQSDDHVGAELVTAAGEPDDLGGELLSEIEQLAGTRRVLLWAHGSASVAGIAAQRANYRQTRVLLQMRRSLTDLEITAIEPPAGVTIRPFVPGADDRSWLAVNARAFADHPEQGSWTQDDLDQRLQAPWFDPAGFLLAERGTELLGYHWTKIHSEQPEPIGEVYVLGVDPAAQGMKLGSLLLNAGLAYLRDRGLKSVLLYSEESNTKAVRLYEKRGFTVVATDIQYAGS